MGQITKTKFYSHKIGALCKGCTQCIKGRKLVLYVTGLCHRSCYFCPLSDSRKNQDIIWANEKLVKKDKEIIDEARLNGSMGAGITGGEPLLKLSRTLKYIKMLKKEFGPKFHIHLYTSLELITYDKLKKLYNAGLDEIRFHPDLECQDYWDRLILAKNFTWKVGVEIPVIPGKYDETLQLVDYLKGKVDFLNLNELEISDNNANSLNEKGYVCKDNISYAIKGSSQMALQLMKYLESSNLKVHFCTGKLKDKVQLGNRLKLRAKNVAKRYDVITEDGTLLRGVFYLARLAPGISLKKKLLKVDRKKTLLELNKLKKTLMKEYDIPSILIEVDKERLQILTASWVVDELKLDNSAIIEEYPTSDRLIVGVY